MLARVKKLYKQWVADRQQLRELTIKLEALVDPHFLDRALVYEAFIKFHVVKELYRRSLL